MHSKIVEFQKVKVQNFLSYGNDPIEVTFEKGVTFVTGYNKDTDSKNGVGKTSLIVESLSFLLFGETYRKINQKLIKNNITNNTCTVEGWLKVNDDDVYIIRSIGPNILRLSINGDSDKYTKSIPETTKDIATLLGITSNVFTNTIVMTNKDTKGFINSAKADKVKFIESILGLESFADFFKEAKDKLKSIEEARASKRATLDRSIQLLDADKRYAISYKTEHENQLTKLQSNLDALKAIQPKDHTETIRAKRAEQEVLSSEISEISPKLDKANKKLYELNYQLKQKRSDLQSLQNKETVCQRCKRPLLEHNLEEMEKEKTDLESVISELTTSAKKFSTAISKAELTISNKKTAIRQIDNEIKNLEGEQDLYVASQKKIDAIAREIDQKSIYKCPFEEKLVKSQSDIDQYQSEYDDLAHKSKLFTAVKDVASPAGVKTLLIAKILDTLNDRVNYYLNRLHAPFKVTFDEFFEESFTSLNGIEYSYGSFSGGEAKRIDFALLFAFRDIRRIQSNVHVNLTVMDELFDSALCEKGMEDIVNLLGEMEDECFMIVTHRLSNIEQNNCRVIDLIKENGITRLNVEK